jgi:hypothetical protein
VGGLTGERQAVVLRWWWRCWVVVGVGGFGFKGGEGQRCGDGVCTAPGKNGEGGGNTDLKNYSCWPKTEYVRMHKDAFDHTRAGEWCVCA